VLAAGMSRGWSHLWIRNRGVPKRGEFQNPKTDTFKGISISGWLCVVVDTLVRRLPGLSGMGTMVPCSRFDAAAM